MNHKARQALPVLQLIAIVACLAAILWEGGRRDMQLAQVAETARELSSAVATGAINTARQEQVLVDIQRRLTRLER